MNTQHKATQHTQFITVLKKYDFHKHNAHSWLLKKRQEREAILQREGLAALFNFNQAPFFIGEIARTETRYDWGNVLFVSAHPELEASVPCSVYGAFDYLIRQCRMFPMFISVSDVSRCASEDRQSMPVYGLPFSFNNIAPGRQQALINKMLSLHRVALREKPLVEHVVEVADEALFDSLFGDYLQQKREQQVDAMTGVEVDGYDTLMGRHF